MLNVKVKIKKIATTFTTCVKDKTEKNTYRVYIRVTHARKSLNIPTGKFIIANKVKVTIDEKGRETKEIKCKDTLGECAVIQEYFKERLKDIDTDTMTVAEIKAFLTKDTDEIPFVPFCKEYISNLYSERASNTADGYMDALKSFIKHFGDKITFQQIDTAGLENWIKSLAHTKRAKEKYPQLIQAMFDAGRKKYNDYNKKIYKIENLPFETLVIPKSDPTEPEPISVENLRRIFGFAPDEDFKHSIRCQKAQDIMKLSFYFVGMNTVDLFNMRKENYRGGKLCYNRTKTKSTGQHKGYTEVTVLPEVQDVFDKYMNTGEGENLFEFGYGNPKDLYKNVNKGLKKICEVLGIEKVTTANFRDSWATVADNYFGIDESKIDFCLTHAPKARLIRKYVRKTYTAVDEVNKLVTDLVFFPERLEKEVKEDRKDEELYQIEGSEGLGVAV